MLRKSCSPLKRGYLCSFLTVSLPFFLPFVLPTLSHFPFSLSLSLSLSLFLVIFLFSSFLVCFIVSFLVFCFCFLPCFFAFGSCKEERQDITSERFFSSMLILLGWFPIFSLVFEIPTPSVIFAFSHGPSPCLVFLFLLFLLLLSFFVLVLCLLLLLFLCLLKMSEKRESYPTSHLTARLLNILLQKCLFLSTNFLIHKEGVLEVSSQKPYFCSVFAKFHSCFWEMLRQNWELPH